MMRSIKPPKPSGVRDVIEVARHRVSMAANADKIKPFESAHMEFTELVHSDARCKDHPIANIDACRQDGPGAGAAILCG